MRDKAIKVVVAGVGGYGKMYLRHLLSTAVPAELGAVRIVGIADPAPTRCAHYADVVAAGIPIFPSLESFYQTETADLAVIATPVQLHAQHIELALAHGSHVLCEKPLASCPADAQQLMRLRDRAKRHVAIGYQWSYCPAMRDLKRDIAAGLLGKPLRMRTLVLWPRGDQYYARNRWAGRVRDDAGLLVLDSPLHNACAHFVHNAFYVLGDATDASAWPSQVTAELYRAHPTIENYDTAAVRCRVGNGVGNGAGVEAMFIVSHAVPDRRGPDFCYEFEDAVVTFEDDLSPSAAGHDYDAQASNGNGRPSAHSNGKHNGNGHDNRNGNGSGNGNGNGQADGNGNGHALTAERGVVVAHLRDGRVKHYGTPATSADPAKLWHILECIRENRAPVCGIEATAAQTACIAASQASMPTVQPFDPERMRAADTPTGLTHWVRDLAGELTDCYRSMQLPSERGFGWAHPGRQVAVEPFLGATDGPESPTLRAGRPPTAHHSEPARVVQS